MGLAAGKAVRDGRNAAGAVAGPGTVIYATGALTSLAHRLRMSLPEADIAVCLAAGLRHPITDLDSHPPWWTSLSRAVSETSR